LPVASVTRDLESAPLVAVDEHGVQLNGVPVAALAQLDGDDWKIPDLHDQLVTLKNNFKLLHPSEKFSGTVIVLADREISFRILKRILYSCRVADYPNVDFIVQQKS
jgi:hypothetical protein